jgi:ABC-type nitrate/sulfonate/bicarbonate transport system substrate-binding protein
MLVAAALGSSPASAQAPPQKLTIALAGKALAFVIQYVAIGGSYYKDEGIDPEIVYVASGTRQAAAAMGGSADITQVGLPHGLEAVAHGGTLVAIGTAFDKYPIALVLTNDAIKRMGITQAMSLDEKIKRLHGLRIGITSPGSSTDELCARSCRCAGWIRPPRCDCSRSASAHRWWPQPRAAASTASPTCRRSSI